jgi:hypothetical protein
MGSSVARSAGRHGPVFLICLLTQGLGLAQGPGPIAPLNGPYPLLDQVHGAHTRLATFPIRPMVESPDGSALWVVNQTQSTLERFLYPGTTPTAFPVPWDPVAVAYWKGTADGTEDDELLVACRGTWAVAVLDLNGNLKTTIQMRPGDVVHPPGAARMGMMAEPGDVVVDQDNHRAFVSCSGADSVLQIDLTTHRVVRVFSHVVAGDDFRLKHPLFLSIDPTDGQVYVAPMHAGNQSMAERSLVIGQTILNVPLPDQDLFRITPYLNAGSPGSVTPVSTGNGAILFMHGRNGPGGDYWQLGTDALNKVHQSEPDAKGKFVVNQAMRISNPFTAGETKALIPLDPVGYPSGGFLQNGEQLGQPFALSFHPNGKVFLIGLLTPRVVVLNSDGTFYKEWDLPAGHRLPRGVLGGVNPTVVHVYCYDSNAVLTYRWNTAGPGLLGTRFLSHDPTPAVAKAGRLVFFDGSNSQFGNISCASCHVDGGSDELAWNLSNAPLEQKGPMITQTLVGLERLPPFHWRGERQLLDFRGAFQGLLGKPTELPLLQFQDMEAFVFSLRNPSNPNQNRDRILDATIHGPDPMASIDPGTVLHTVVTGNAVLGAGNFSQNNLPNEPPIFAGREFTCSNCHRLPTGTGNDINPEQNAGFTPRRLSMKPTPFHELWRKQQPLLPISLGGSTIAAPLIGTGFSHMGMFTNLFRFVDVVVKLGTTPVDFDQVTANVADFIHQWDQGFAPAAQFAFHLDQSSAGLAAQELDGYLTTQRAAGNCDVGVIGQVFNGALVTRRWFYSRRLSLFVCEDPSFTHRTLADFENPVNLAAGESNTFLGLPIALAERLVDHDQDKVLNMDPLETAPLDPAIPGLPDTLAPQFNVGGGPTVRWATTRVARLTFDTNEPTTAEVRYWDQAQGLVSEQKVFATSLSRAHSLILPGLRGGTPRPSHQFPPFQFNSEVVQYSYEVTIRDRLGNATISQILPLAPADFIELAGFDWASLHDADAAEHREHFVQKLCLGGPACDNVTSLGNNQWRVQVQATVAFKRGQWVIPAGGTALANPRAPDRALAGRVFVRRANGVVLSAAQAGLTVTPSAGVPGPDCALVNKVFSSPMSGTSGERELGLNLFTGPFLVTTAATLTDGIATLTFDVDGNSGQQLFPGDRIVFVVEALIDVDAAAAPAAIDLTTVAGEARFRSPRPRVALSTWTFPDSKEVGGTVETRGL